MESYNRFYHYDELLEHYNSKNKNFIMQTYNETTGLFEDIMLYNPRTDEFDTPHYMHLDLEEFVETEDATRNLY